MAVNKKFMNVKTKVVYLSKWHSRLNADPLTNQSNIRNVLGQLAVFLYLIITGGLGKVLHY